MTDKEKIRAEVKRRKDELHYLPFTDENLGKINAYEFVLKIIDSLSEEPVSEDLEAAAENYAAGYEQVGYDEDQILSVQDAFIDGAKWQKQQMMKGAAKGTVHHFNGDKTATVHYIDPTGVPMCYFTSPEDLKAGDKVKVIVVKEG